MFFEDTTNIPDLFVAKRHANYGYLAHFHRSFELYYIAAGTLRAKINGIDVFAEAGDIVLANPLEIHSYFPSEQASDVYVLIVGEKYLADFYSEYKSVSFKNLLRDKSGNQRIFNVLSQIPLSLYNNVTLSTLAKKACVNYIFDLLIRFYGVVPKKEQEEQIVKIVRYIQEYSSEELSLKGLAEKFNYAETSFSRLFSKYIGSDLRSYISVVRVEAVEQLLNDPVYAGESVLNIMLRCGFNSLATFYRAYKKRYGKLPRIKNRRSSADFSSNY